jgi:hypothetical protein
MLNVLVQTENKMRLQEKNYVLNLYSQFFRSKNYYFKLPNNIVKKYIYLNFSGCSELLIYANLLKGFGGNF